MSSETDNIVVFRPAGDFPVAKREKKRCRCSDVGHLYSASNVPPVWIDEHTRDLECRLCGARIDAFDYLWDVATEGDNMSRDIKRLREEKATLKAQVSLLEEQVKEMSATRRRLAKERSA